MSETYTPLFPIEVHPVRIGVYQLRSPSGDFHYSKWNGVHWCMSSRSKREAAAEVLPSGGVISGFYRQWRGLAEGGAA